MPPGLRGAIKLEIRKTSSCLFPLHSFLLPLPLILRSMICCHTSSKGKTVALFFSSVIHQTFVPWSVKHPGEMDVQVPSFSLEGTHNTLLGGRTNVPVLGSPRTGSPTAGSLGEYHKPITPLEPSFSPQSNSGNWIS